MLSSPPKSSEWSQLSPEAISYGGEDKGEAQEEGECEGLIYFGVIVSH